jgi:hypothetical protein
MANFDLRNAVLEDFLDSNLYPPRLEITTMQTLKEALDNGVLSPDTELLTFEYDGNLMTFPLATVVCYNVIQGQLNDKAWMMTFCNACNAGMVFDPVMNGETLRFHRRGSYNGLLLIWDDNTDTYWNHITGEAIHGAKVGAQLKTLTPTRQMKASDALAFNADARVLITTPSETEADLSKMMMKMQKKPQKFSDVVVDMLVYEDTRLPRYTLGLGLWEGDHSIYYPVTSIYANNNVLITEFEGRNLLIYQSPDAIAPTAVYLEDVKSAHWQDDTLRINTGATIRNDQYTNPDGKIEALERPMQLLMRWYGFALTFPNSAIGEVSPV